ncbi:hypothetical protein L1987_56952 [Smallanthus sonchifolius]|uniref:Uncharacterized protein n=1 Tax=Smallanthus sonchifolius TaxID=185202 RepID=A0ACB9DBN5_9ASTR|nr:hypothetical protein L1987_56952 [Smallanthus sonchifolius]
MFSAMTGEETYLLKNEIEDTFMRLLRYFPEGAVNVYINNHDQQFSPNRNKSKVDKNVRLDSEDRQRNKKSR